MFKFIVAALLVCFSAQALAWDGTVTGKILRVDVVPAEGDNAGFRITLENAPVMCGNQHNWAYINRSDNNYDAAVSVLLAAKLSQTPVTVYSNRNTSWSNYCHIGYVIIR